MHIPPEFVFDVQVKRMHEYKRQLLNALSIMDKKSSPRKAAWPTLPYGVYEFDAKARKLPAICGPRA